MSQQEVLRMPLQEVLRKPLQEVLRKPLQEVLKNPITNSRLPYLYKRSLNLVEKVLDPSRLVLSFNYVDIPVLDVTWPDPLGQ